VEGGKMGTIIHYNITIVVWTFVLVPCWAGNGVNLVDGLVAYLPFDEGEGNIAYDIAGNNNATIAGAQWSTGHIGGALSFDGIDDYASIPSSDDLDIRGSVTLCGWVKNNNDDDGQIVWRGGPLGAHDPYELHMSDSKMQFRVDLGDGNEIYTVDSLESVDDKWHFWTGIYSKEKATIYLYKDGLLENTTSVFHEIEYDTSTMWNMIGAVGNGKWQHFNGTIDEIAIYRRVLSEDEILQMYEYGFSNFDTAILRIKKSIVQKLVVLVDLDAALEQEYKAYQAFEDLLQSRNNNALTQGDIEKAKQDIYSAIQDQEHCKDEIDKSINKLRDALIILGFNFPSTQSKIK
jgi:hypothetical protein